MMTAPERQFRERLDRTVAWCNSRVKATNPRWCLRSPELRPAVEFENHSDPSLWNEHALIEGVVQRRAALLARSPLTDVDPRQGRLLWCRYEYNNHNGASDHYSQGFFDANDNPPWDTWIGQVDDALITWVPGAFVDLASEGISVECCDMLDWVVNRSACLPEWLVRNAREIEMAG